MSAELELVVAADGTVTIEALGEVESRECKVSFYESVAEGEQLSQREGSRVENGGESWLRNRRSFSNANKAFGL